MENRNAGYEVVFPDWYDARVEAETPAKGHLDDVIVKLGGKAYRLSFVDDYNLKTGWVEPDQPGVVVLDEVSTASILSAVPGLIERGFFDELKPEPVGAG